MKKNFTITIGDHSFPAVAGDKLLDAALRNGVDLLHDCRAGHCGACVVEVLRGVTLGGDVSAGSVKACQARIFSEIKIVANDAPHPNRRRAVVEGVRDLATGVVEVSIRLRRPLSWRPGQYVKLQFRGQPARSFSPTASLLHGGFSDDRMVFHIKKVRGGRVTPLLGDTIRAGSPLSVEGPFGHAFLREAHAGRLVLLGSGTGFAPIWAIAAAALEADPERAIFLACGARHADSFYMGPSLRTAARHSGVDLRVCLEEIAPGLIGIHRGTPANHLPDLTPEDTVFAAGGPRMVAEAERKATAAGARFYADPFSPAVPPDDRATKGSPPKTFRRLADLLGQRRTA